MQDIIRHCFRPIKSVEELLQEGWTYAKDGLPNNSCVCYVMKRHKQFSDYEYSVALLKYDSKHRKFIEKGSINDVSVNYAWKVI